MKLSLRGGFGKNAKTTGGGGHVKTTWRSKMDDPIVEFDDWNRVLRESVPVALQAGYR